MRRKPSPPVYYLDDDDDRTTSDQHPSNLLRTISPSVSLKRKKSNEIHSKAIAHPNPTDFSRTKKQKQPATTIANIQPILIDTDQTDEDDDDPSLFYRAFDWTTDFEQPSTNRTLLLPSLLPPAKISFASDSSLNSRSTTSSTIENSSRTRSYPHAEPSLFFVKEKNPSDSSTVKPKEKQTTDRSTLTEKSVPSTFSTFFVTESTRDLDQFSAFFDSKYYRCNMCRFKSVTSSTLLQHLFSHLFICDYCSYFTFTQWVMTEHQFKEHQDKVTTGEINEQDPKLTQFLYVTRSNDGTFALCAKTSAMVQEKFVDKPEPVVVTKKTTHRISKEKSVPVQLKPTTIRTKKTKNSFGVRFLDKNGIHYILKGVSKNTPLTLEYKRCREQMIRTICETESIARNRNERTMIDDVAQCIRTVVAGEPRTKSMVQEILLNEDFSQVFDSLKLCHRDRRSNEIEPISSKNSSFQFDDHHKIILIPNDRKKKKQNITGLLNLSSKTEESTFVQAKPKKSSKTNDNSELFLKKSTQNRTKGKPISTSRFVQKHPLASPSNRIDVVFEQSPSSIQTPKSNSPEEAISVIVID